MTTAALDRLPQAARLGMHLERYAWAYYTGLSVVAIAAGWFPRLTWGFWTDEAGTFWMAGGHFFESLSRSARFPGQSVLYGGLMSWFYHPGPHQELWMRIPSVLGVLAAAFFLYRLTESILGRGTGFLAVVPFLCTASILTAATNARPYGLALAAATGSYWKFHQWMESGTRKHLIQYLLLSVAVLYLQYFFAFLFVSQLLVLGWRSLRGGKVPWGTVTLAGVILAVSILPLLPSLRTLVHFASSAYNSSVPPTLLQLAIQCFPPGALIAGVVGCAAVGFLFPRGFKLRGDVSAESTVLVLTWQLAAPLTFFVVGHFTRFQPFATRYLLFATPGFFVLLAWMIRQVPAVNHRLLVLFAILGGTVLHPANLLATFSGPEEDWRAAVATLREWSGSDRPPVFVRSGIAESNLSDWRNGAQPDSYLLTPLAAYPIDNPTLCVPFFFTSGVAVYVQEKLDGELRNAPRVLVVASTGSEILPWMQEQLKSRGYISDSRENAGYTVIRFLKGG
jgi:hypothetical protein